METTSRMPNNAKQHVEWRNLVQPTPHTVQNTLLATQHNVARTSSQNNGQIKTIPGVRIGNGTVVTGVTDVLEIVTSTTASPTSTTPPHPPRTAPPT